MNAESLFIGPQLIGIILLAVGFIQKRFPPKSINAFYGYRMPSSMKTQQTWDTANRYSAILMIKIGIVLIVTGVALSATLGVLNIKNDLRVGISAIILMATSIISCILLIVLTEKHLSKKFDT
ncbi:SdpI/YhfL protein family [Mucilaginibacter hurinus]|uniref:SdpI/YhfL protein family n=1 Tax=Mucilaginibacter hurinus TaxID=2201324 RepID=A0A367GP02_9SPHI|nr:SdpI family protein [Mucilaginibacter hurinus]RCH54788.1 SdpI/YhfL protein family [Mucilaginibacter hurinus]